MCKYATINFTSLQCFDGANIIACVSIIANYYSVIAKQLKHAGAQSRNSTVGHRNDFRLIRMSAALKSDQRAAARLKFLQEARARTIEPIEANAYFVGRGGISIFNVMAFAVAVYRHPRVVRVHRDREYRRVNKSRCRVGECVRTRPRPLGQRFGERVHTRSGRDKCELMAVCPGVERSSTPN